MQEVQQLQQFRGNEKDKKKKQAECEQKLYQLLYEGENKLDRPDTFALECF